MEEISSVTYDGLSFQVDSMILLRPVEINSAIHGALDIVIMQGSDHDKRLRWHEKDSSSRRRRCT